MRLIKRILGKIHHIVVDLGSHLLGDPACHAPRHSFLFVAINKVSALLFHYGLLFLTHGTAHKIAPPQGISSKVTDDLHHLLLINNTAVSGGKDRLQLRAGIGNGPASLSLNILRDKVHGPRTVQGDPRYHILQILRLQLFHKAFHAAAF